MRTHRINRNETDSNRMEKMLFLLSIPIQMANCRYEHMTILNQCEFVQFIFIGNLHFDKIPNVLGSNEIES